MIARIPPHSEESERGLIGSILIGSEDALTYCQVKGVTPTSFYVPANRAIYECATSLHANGRPVNLMTVCDKMGESGTLDQAGGRVYMESLVADCPTSTVAQYCADRVLEKEQARTLIDVARVTMESLYAGDDDVQKIRADHELAVSRACPGESFNITLADAANAVLDRWTKRDEKTSAVTLPWNWLNISFGDLTDELIYLAAQPSIGKTAAATNIAVWNARRGANVLFYSLESSVQNLSRRFISHMAQVNCLRIRIGAATVDDMDAARRAVLEMRGLPITVLDEPMTEAQLCASAKRHRSKGKCDLLIIDNLKHVQPSKKHNSEPERFKAISEELKWLRDDLRCPVIVLHHLTDEMKMAWSRDITRDADIILNMIATDGPRDINPRRVEWVIEKNREGIAGVKSTMAFFTDVQTFRQERT